MKTIDIVDATRPLSDYASEADEPLIILRAGQPVAAVVPLPDEDLESLSLGTNLDFLALIRRSREETREGGTLSLEEMRRRFDEAA